MMASLLIASVATIAYSETPAKPDSDTYIYQPKPDFTPLDGDHIVVKPKTPGTGNGAAQWCDTLRGKGVVAIALGEVIIFLAIECPERIMNDI
jgi:hypothetical protein